MNKCAHALSGASERFVQLGFSRRYIPRSIVGETRGQFRVVYPGRADHRVDVAGIKRQRAVEQVARLGQKLGRVTLVRPSHALKIEVHRIGICRPLGTPRLGGDQLRPQLIGEPRDNLVLHVEEIGERLVEPLGPDMVAALCVDELHVDTQPVAAALHAAFERIADVQFAANRLHVDGFTLVRKCRIAGDHE